MHKHGKNFALLFFHLPNDANVLVVLIVMDKSILPSKITVHVLLAPPAGDDPVKKSPRRIAGLFGKSSNPSA